MPALPQPVIVALADERLVVALGANAARAALGGSRSQGADLSEVRELLGDDVDPVADLELDRLLTAIGSFQGQPGPGLAEARDVVERLRPIALGASREGGTLTLRLATTPE